MKYALILTFLFCFGCRNHVSENTMIVQACLNKMEASNRLNYLKNGKVVLIKDSITQTLSGLYLRKVKIPVKKVNTSDLTIYVPDLKNVLSLPIYLRLDKIAEQNNEALLKLSLPNVNETITFKLKKLEEVWTVQYFTERVY